MNLDFLKNKKTQKQLTLKKEVINIHKIWLILVMTAVIIIAIEMIVFSWFFNKTTNDLDKPATPELKTNSTKINSIIKILNDIEKTVNSRIDSFDESSQNTN